MANPNARTYDLDLASPDLNLDKYKSDISQFQGFNNRNSPFISHEIKNLYTKSLNSNSWVSEDEDEYTVTEDRFVKNNKTRWTFNSNFVFEVGNAADGGNLVGYLTLSNNTTHYHIYSEQIANGNVRLLCATLIVNLGNTCVENSISVLNTTTSEAVIGYQTTDNKYMVVVLGSNGNQLIVKVPPFVILDSLSDSFVDVVCLQYNNRNFLCINYASSNGFIETLNILAFTSNDWVGCEVTAIPPGHYVATNEGIVPCEADKFTIMNDGRLSYLRTLLWNSTTGVVSFYATYLTNFDTTRYSKYTNKDIFKQYYNKFGTVTTIGSYEIDGYTIYLSVSDRGDIFEFGNEISGNSVEGYRIQLGHNITNQYYQVIGRLHLLFNSGIVSSVSVTEDTNKNTRGTLLFPFYLIENIKSYQVSPGGILELLVANDNKQNTFFCELKFIINNNPKINFVTAFNRYLIFNVADYYNAYDIKNNVMFHFGDDWNNRIGIYKGRPADTYRRGWVATCVNAFFEAETSFSPSLQSNPVCGCHGIYKQELYETIELMADGIPTVSNPLNYGYIDYGIDCFFNNDVTNSIPSYMNTIKHYTNRRIVLINFSSEDPYPITDGNQILPLPASVKFTIGDIVSLAYNDDLNFGVPLMLVGTTEYALYFLLTAQENIEKLFCIQTGYFAIANDTIYSLTYANGLYAGIQKVAYIYGLEYLCSTPIAAFFWSPFNKTLYQFMGDNLLHRGQTIDEINKVYQVKYICATNDIVMCTDKYAIVLSEQYAYKIENINNKPFTDVFWTINHFCLRNEDSIVMVTYNKTTDHTKQPIKITTKLYGLGNNLLSETDCVYVRVFNAEKETTPQIVRIGGFTLTNEKHALLERTYTINEWDDDYTYYIRYQPTYQKALGIQIEIESTVPITYIGINNIPDAKMITKN